MISRKHSLLVLAAATLAGVFLFSEVGSGLAFAQRGGRGGGGARSAGVARAVPRFARGGNWSGGNWAGRGWGGRGWGGWGVGLGWGYPYYGWGWGYPYYGSYGYGYPGYAYNYSYPYYYGTPSYGYDYGYPARASGYAYDQGYPAYGYSYSQPYDYNNQGYGGYAQQPYQQPYTTGYPPYAGYGNPANGVERQDMGRTAQGQNAPQGQMNNRDNTGVRTLPTVPPPSTTTTPSNSGRSETANQHNARAAGTR